MLRTKTVCLTPEEDISDVANRWEARGWAVRQIVLNPAYGTTYIVFEGEQPDASTGIGLVPLPTYQPRRIVSRSIRAERETTKLVPLSLTGPAQRD